MIHANLSIDLLEINNKIEWPNIIIEKASIDDSQ